jgi:integrase
LRLSWNEVNLISGYVQITAAKAKSARRRLIPISDNLRQWLAAYAGHATGALLPMRRQTYHKACTCAAHQAGLVHWPKNGLRHSYASYHLAHHQNAPELSLHLGHTNPRQVFDAYREVVSRESAVRYWSIRPQQTPSNMVAFKVGAAS